MRHTKEPWEVDHRECDGVRYFVITGPDGKTILDTMNSESQLIEEEYDEDGFCDQWDEQGKLDLERASVCVNACRGIADPSAIPALICYVSDVVTPVLAGIRFFNGPDDRALVQCHDAAVKLMALLAKLKGGA